MAADQPPGKITPTSDDPAGREKSKQAVVEHLQAPRKKRKSYVILAVGPNFDLDTSQAIQKFMRTQFSKLSVVVAKSGEDFEKYSNRNIVLAIVDDQLQPIEETLQIVRKAKEQKHDGPLPTLFLTDNPNDLIKAYQKVMPLWHEVDEYLVLSETARHGLFTRIKSGIENKNQRRSRRYKTQIQAGFQVLDSGDTRFVGRIVDFSIHGALLHAENNSHIFSKKDQIVVHLPFGSFVKGHQDVLRVTARVRRVLISGDTAGISWEFLTGEKLALLTKLLTTIVDHHIGKSAAAARAKIAKAQADENIAVPQ